MVNKSIQTWRELWFNHLDASGVTAAVLRPGKMFVERNDELEIDISAGRIEMEIRSGPRMVYNVVIQAPRASKQAWDLFDKHIETNPPLLSEVSHGQLPVEAGVYAQSESIGIMPSWSDCSWSCSCPNSNECKYLYALLYFLGEHFDQDPFELMRFLGRSREQFLASITSSTTSFEYRPQPALQAWQSESPALPECPPLFEGTHELASWPSDPPNTPLFDADGLRSIGEDACLRAGDMLHNGHDSCLGLDEATDLVRRAAQTSDTTTLALNAGLPAEQLKSQVATWRKAGVDGLNAHVSPVSVVPGNQDQTFRQSPTGMWFRFVYDNEILRFDDGPLDDSSVPETIVENP